MNVLMKKTNEKRREKNYWNEMSSNKIRFNQLLCNLEIIITTAYSLYKTDDACSIDEHTHTHKRSNNKLIIIQMSQLMERKSSVSFFFSYTHNQSFLLLFLFVPFVLSSIPFPFSLKQVIRYLYHFVLCSRTYYHSLEFRISFHCFTSVLELFLFFIPQWKI